MKTASLFLKDLKEENKFKRSYQITLTAFQAEPFRSLCYQGIMQTKQALWPIIPFIAVSHFSAHQMLAKY